MNPAQGGLTRRALLGGGLAFAPLAARAAGSQGPLYAFVGTFTPNGGGIHVLRVDPTQGELESVAVVGGLVNPSWLAIDAGRGRLFAACETADFGADRTGSVAAFAIGPGGALRRLNTVSSGAAGPAHLSLDRAGRWAFVSDYADAALAVLPVGADGTLGPATQVWRPAPGVTPPSPAPDGNFAPSDHSRPHLHMAALDPGGRWLIAADAGADRLYVWRFDASAGLIASAAVPFMAAAPGSAPRHFVFDRSGRRLFVLHEHGGAVSSWSFDPEDGALAPISQAQSLPDGFKGSDLGSELRLAPDGRFLYAANRLRDSIEAFAVHADGRLTRVAEAWTQGDYPRSFAFTPDGRWLLACCQKSDALTVFKVDIRSGRLTFTGRFYAVGSPACVAFA